MKGKMKMNKVLIMAAVAAIGLAGFAGEHDTPQKSGDFVQLVAGEPVYAGNIALVGTNGLAYAANTSAVVGGTVCGVFLRSAAAGEKVLAKRGGFVLDNAASGTVEKKDIGATAYSVSSNAWTVTKTSGGKTVGKVADVREDGSVVVIVGR